MYAHSSVYVCIYLFIHCKLESFLILTRDIKKLGLTGLTGSRAARGNLTSNHFRKASLTSCKAGGCLMDVHHSFLYCFKVDNYITVNL